MYNISSNSDYIWKFTTTINLLQPVIHERNGPIISGPALGGMMLFLAVTLGFFVENKREHMVEHGRERKYINNLFQDLKQGIK